MTGLYLEKLRALKSQNAAIEALPKLTKHSPAVDVTQRATANESFGSFDSTHGTAFSDFPARYSWVVTALEAGCPDLVPVNRWQLAVDDARAFLARWGDQAEALGWEAKHLFGLHKPPAQPHPSYRRLSRYDETGLVWLLQGRKVVALTETTATIQNPAGAITIYRRHYKPAFGPVGDSLDDLVPPFGGNDVSGAPSVRGALAAMTDKQTSR